MIDKFKKVIEIAALWLIATFGGNLFGMEDLRFG